MSKKYIYYSFLTKHICVTYMLKGRISYSFNYINRNVHTQYTFEHQPWCSWRAEFRFFISILFYLFYLFMYFHFLKFIYIL